MRIVEDWRAVPAAARGASLALGNFDGVHLGHARVVRAAHGAEPRVPLGVVTFEPHPRRFFRPQDPPFRLTLPTERAAALAALGVEWVFQLRFDEAFSLMPAEEFVAGVLHQGLGARHLACGGDFAFGHRRGGDTTLLAREAEARGIGLTLVPHLADAEGPISSSRIRRALEDGYPERATAALGRPWAIRGVVTEGDHEAREFGVPTANVALGEHLEPARGVYAVSVRLAEGTERPGVGYVGRRPTTPGETPRQIEAHLFDWAGDLYGTEIAVSLHRFLRPDRRFPDLAGLRAQIAADTEEARRIMDAGGGRPLCSPAREDR